MMSTILSKTFEQTVSFLGGKSPLRSEYDITLAELQEGVLFRNVHQEELNRKVIGCMDMLKRKSQDLHLSLPARRECLLIISFLCGMNEDCGCLHPFVIKCIEDATTVCDKSVAYTALVSMNQKSSSNAYLAVNTLLKDLTSRNEVIRCTALSAACFLMDVDLIPVFLPSIEKLLKGDSLKVKYKALVVLHCMLKIAPEYLVSIWDEVVRALCDRNPYIMGGSLPILDTLLKSAFPPKELKIGEKVVFILKQVEQGSLPIGMMYGGISGPWIQIRLISIIRSLPQEELSQSGLTHLQVVFENIFARFQSPKQVQYAIISECISTIISLHPRLEKLESVAFDAIERFLNSSKPNLFVTGVELLKSAVTVRPGCSRTHSESLLACLSGGGEVVVKPALQLMDDFVTADNSVSVIKAMMKSLTSSGGSNKKEILLTLLDIIEKYPMDTEWILHNYNHLSGAVSDEFDPRVMKGLIRCLQSVPIESMEKESLRLTKLLKQQSSALQYCMSLEIISFYNKTFTKQDCDRVMKAIMDNFGREQWTVVESEAVELVSWNTALSLITQHNASISPKDILKNPRSHKSGMAHQIYTEACTLTHNMQLAVKCFPTQYSDLNSTRIEPDLHFLKDFTEANGSLSDVEEEFEGSSKSLMLEESDKSSKFKIEPYTKSRFSRRDCPSDVGTAVKKKNVFLSAGSRGKESEKQTGKWNKSNYVLQRTDNTSKDDEKHCDEHHEKPPFPIS